MVPFYTTKISTALLALSLVMGRGIYGSGQALANMQETKSSQGSVIETPEEENTKASASPTTEASKVSKIDVGEKTKALPTEEPTLEPTSESTPETQQQTQSNKTNTSNNNSSGSNGSSQSSQQASQPMQQPAQQETQQQQSQPAQEATPEPAPEQGDGYYPDQKSCVAAARSNNALNYSCSGPLDDGSWYLWWSK